MVGVMKGVVVYSKVRGGVECEKGRGSCADLPPLGGRAFG